MLSKNNHRHLMLAALTAVFCGCTSSPPPIPVVEQASAQRRALEYASLQLSREHDLVVLKGRVSSENEQVKLVQRISDMFGAGVDAHALVVDSSVRTADWINQVLAVIQNMAISTDFKVQVQGANLLLGGPVTNRQQSDDFIRDAYALLAGRLQVQDKFLQLASADDGFPTEPAFAASATDSEINSPSESFATLAQQLLQAWEQGNGRQRTDQNSVQGQQARATGESEVPKNAPQQLARREVLLTDDYGRVYGDQMQVQEGGSAPDHPPSIASVPLARLQGEENTQQANQLIEDLVVLDEVSRSTKPLIHAAQPAQLRIATMQQPPPKSGWDNIGVVPIGVAPIISPSPSPSPRLAAAEPAPRYVGTFEPPVFQPPSFDSSINPQLSTKHEQTLRSAQPRAEHSVANTAKSIEKSSDLVDASAEVTFSVRRVGSSMQPESPPTSLRGVTSEPPSVASNQDTTLQLNGYLKNVRFYGRTDRLTLRARTTLEQLALILHARPTTRLAVLSYSSNSGPEVELKQRAHKRARSVITYLTRQGVESDRLQGYAFGHVNGSSDQIVIQEVY